jgi:uncharacterized Fe-S cluster-containing MiaB family protein
LPVSSARTRLAIAVTFTPSTADEQIRRLRPPKPVVDPWKAHDTIVEDERSLRGSLERAVTVFLAGAECPFTCSFCDLWRWTLEGATPVGALPIQLSRALASLQFPPPSRRKLYNASNFFDRRAVPPQDLPKIAELARPFGAVTVESHANLVGSATLDFRALLAGRLEVAIGLETIHPDAMAHLNKRMDLGAFERAATFLTRHDIDLRVFVLLGAPYVPADLAIEWTVRAVEYASARGAGRIAIIPVRDGNGELARLRQLGHFTPPTLRELERALEQCLGLTPIVTADLWDVARLPACAVCRTQRVSRLEQMNATGRAAPVVECGACA